MMPYRNPTTPLPSTSSPPFSFEQTEFPFVFKDHYGGVVMDNNKTYGSSSISPKKGKNFTDRLKSFYSCGASKLRDLALFLATIGFIFTGVQSTVICVECDFSVEINDETGEEIERKHQNASPNCPFVRGDVREEPEDPVPAPKPRAVVMSRNASSPSREHPNDHGASLGDAVRSITFKVPSGNSPSPPLLANNPFINSRPTKSLPTLPNGVDRPQPFQEYRSVDSATRRNKMSDVIKDDIINEDIYSATGGSGSLSFSFGDKLPEELVLRSLNDADMGFPQFKLQRDRLATFSISKWPPNYPSSSKEMADAGFFLTKEYDIVVCFYCKIALRDWRISEAPTTEHARHSPNCQYLRKSIRGFVVDQIREYPRDKSTVTSVILPATADLVRPFYSLLTHPPRTEYLASSATNLPTDADRTNKKPEDKYPVDPREVRARMDVPMVRLVLEKGYEPELVQLVIDTRLRSVGDDFKSAMELMTACNAAKRDPSLILPKASYVSKRPQAANNNSGLISETHPPPAPEPAPRPVIQVLTQQKTSKKKKKSKQKSDPTVATAQTNQSDLPLQQVECKICMDQPADVVLIPCGHFVSCQNCAASFSICPICRTRIQRTQKIYM